jgi:hypothetical protein
MSLVSTETGYIEPRQSDFLLISNKGRDARGDLRHLSWVDVGSRSPAAFSHLL